MTLRGGEPAGTRLFLFLALLGGLGLAAGLLLDWERAWLNVLLLSMFLLSLGLAGAFLVALEYVTGATWSVALRRIPEAMTAVLPAGAVGIALVLLVGHAIYPWAGPEGHAEGFRGAWLNPPLLLLRSAVYLALWIALARAMVLTSRRQDADGRPDHTVRNRRLAALFMVVFALTFWMASFDWIMSLEAHWYSTMFGLYNFAGLFLSGIAATVVLAVLLRRLGVLVRAPTPGHLHDLGKLLFAFSTFWMYIWFSQYMLIWYANIPEETAYFVVRFAPEWRPLVWVSVLLNWVVPFVFLMSRRAKRSDTILVRVAIVILIGRWLDLYLMIVPSVTPGAPVFGVLEAACALGGIGVFGLLFARAFGRAAPEPLRDPYLAESLHPSH